MNPVNRDLKQPLAKAFALGSEVEAGSRGRALVVEDNAVNQEMARAMLDMLGFHVTTASNGHEGVLAAAATPTSISFSWTARCR